MAEMTIAPVATYGFFIDGRWIEDGDIVDVRAPYDGSVIARVVQARREHAAAAIAEMGTPVFAKKGETLEEYWDYTHRILQWHDGGAPNLILDDGGDATLLLHLGSDAEKDIGLVKDTKYHQGNPIRFFTS